METALRTPEILDLIFQHLRFTSASDLVTSHDDRDDLRLSSSSSLFSLNVMRSWAKKRVTLLNAGLACRAFFEPAMANLWWCVEGIVPFVRLVNGVRVKRNQGGYPQHHLNHQVNQYAGVREWELSTDIQEEDLTRFDFYAKQVTQIVDLTRHSGTSTEDTLSHILIHLAELRPSSTCFPKLRSVHTTSFNPSTLLFYTSPSLQNLYLRGFWSEDKFSAMCAVLRRCARRSRALVELEIPFVPAKEAVEDLTTYLVNLRYICVRGSVVGASVPFGEFISAVGGLERLERLDVNCSGGVGGGGASSEITPNTTTTTAKTTAAGGAEGEEPQKIWFPSLTSTTLEGTPTQILSVLQHLHSTPLLSLSIKLNWTSSNHTLTLDDLGTTPPPGVPIPEEIQILTNTIHRQFCRLESVEVEYRVGRMSRAYGGPYGVNGGGGGRLEVPVEVFRPLLFARLRTLLVDRSFSIPNLSGSSGSGSGSGADQFLEEVVETCRGLVKLSLPTLSRPVLFSFGGVKRLVQELRCLEELRVDFDGTAISIATMPSTQPNGIASPNLRILDVRSSPITNLNKRSVALTLARTFPNLHTLSYTRDPSPSSLHPGSTKLGTPALWKEVVEWLPVIMGRYGTGVNDENSEEEVDGNSRPGSGLVYNADIDGEEGAAPIPSFYVPPMIPVATTDSDSDDPLGYDSEEY